MREVFKRVGIEDVRVPVNSNREHELITLKEAHQRIAGGEKLFIKPVEIKLFTGLILDGCVQSCLENLPEDTQVMAHKPFENDILSEWRFYILNNEIKFIGNYSCDPTFFPSAAEVSDLINENAFSEVNFPCAYTIDVAVMDTFIPAQEVVEYNDMWAIGNYGMENDMYLRMLKERYFEIMRKGY